MRPIKAISWRSLQTVHLIAKLASGPARTRISQATRCLETGMARLTLELLIVAVTALVSNRKVLVHVIRCRFGHSLRPHCDAGAIWSRSSVGIGKKAAARLRLLSAASRTSLTVFNNCPLEMGFTSVAASWGHGFRSSSSMGNSPDARMTGSVMRAQRSFLTSSTPDTSSLFA